MDTLGSLLELVQEHYAGKSRMTCEEIVQGRAELRSDVMWASTKELVFPPDCSAVNGYHIHRDQLSEASCNLRFAVPARTSEDYHQRLVT